MADLRQPKAPSIAGDVEASGPVTIVVPIDLLTESPVAERLGVALARSTGADLELLVAVDITGQSRLSEVMALRCAALEAQGPMGVSWTESTGDRPATVIVDRSRDAGPALLCMELNSRHAPHSMLMSSVIEEVLRRAAVPVLVAGPHLSTSFGACDRVVVADDGSEMASVAAAVATRLTRMLGADQRTVRVRRSPRHNAHGAGPLEMGREVEVIDDDDRARAIVAAVEEPERTILVLGAHQRGGARRFALGAVALDVVRRAPCPVLVVPAASVGCAMARPAVTRTPSQP